jgi:hypothetical protein
LILLLVVYSSRFLLGAGSFLSDCFCSFLSFVVACLIC